MRAGISQIHKQAASFVVDYERAYATLRAVPGWSEGVSWVALDCQQGLRVVELIHMAAHRAHVAATHATNWGMKCAERYFNYAVDVQRKADPWKTEFDALNPETLQGDVRELYDRAKQSIEWTRKNRDQLDEARMPYTPWREAQDMKSEAELAQEWHAAH